MRYFNTRGWRCGIVRKELVELRTQLRTLIITDDQMYDIKGFCKNVREGQELVDL